MSSPTPLWRLLVGTLSRPEYTSEYFDTFYPEILSERMYMDPVRWARFKWYVRFIKKLNVTNLRWEYKHKELICALIAHNGGETIFPSLRTLWWPPSSYSESSYFPLFTSRLRSAILDLDRCTARDLRPPAEDPESDGFLSRLLASSPRLDHLTVCTPFHHIGTNFSGLISSFEHLRVLHLTARISLTSFRGFASLPRMEYLDVFHVSLDDQHPLSRPPSPIPAPHLQFLHVGGTSLSLTQLFFALAAPTLASASVRATWDAPPRTIADGHVDYATCIEALATVSSPAALADVAIALDEDGGPRIREHLLDLLGPLLAFPNIARFALSCPTVGLVAADDHFWAISGAWRKLRHFRLVQAHWDPCVTVDPDDDESVPVPVPTPQVLECFREDCPDLRELCLPHLDVHADVPALFTRVPKERERERERPCHGLGRLSLEARDVYEDDEDRIMAREVMRLGDEKVGEWARYILRLFPNLDGEECLRYCRWSGASSGWMEVFALVRDLGKSQGGSISDGVSSRS
ncbi:hypothetical protein GSI_12309 [Ganoderma sinense ZZ0214-1]|uniref:F-box domain-containing protein n=1 Tax=Ganoderma sinense ZZ0214-1 TaxID=1077348 RepID=A0A2G8RYF8_9APHY|nr:hypothetical protein GSI_12309 [Ganoderma sinense ZZ0214-1]